MDEKQNYPTGSTDPASMPPVSGPPPSAPMYPQNFGNEINAPPPTYSQATTNQFPTGPTSNVIYGSESYTKPVTVVPIATDNSTLDTCSVKLRCNNCSQEQLTRVESKISSNGKMWAICCCCFGSWLLSLFVLCFDGFKEFTHYCPSCNAWVGTYRPTLSGGQVCLLALLSILIIGIQIVLIAAYVFTNSY